MKRLAQFLLVLLFPVSIITMIGVISLYLDYVTSLTFYEVSGHPVTWIVSLIVVIIAYVQSSPEEDNSSERIEDTYAWEDDKIKDTRGY